MKSQSINRFLSGITLVALVTFFSYAPQLAFAASLTSVSDTMSTQAPNVTADHTVAWTQAATHSIAAADTIAIAYTVSGDFTANAAGSWQTTDFALTTNVGSNIAPVAVGAAPSCSSGATNYTVTISGTVLPIFTITACTGWTTTSTASAVTFVIKGATGGTGTLTNRNGDVNSSTFTITDTGSNTDTGTGAVVIETNDVVTVTATVNPTLTFAISSASAALGTITTSTAGKTSHTISVASNAPGGFLVTYNGATLTSGSNTIAAYGTTGAASSPGTAGFGINLRSNSTPSIGADVTQNAGTCGYGTNYGTANTFSFQASTTTTITNVTAPADCVYTASYVGNISTVTPAGAYNTTLTYIATGTF